MRSVLIADDEPSIRLLVREVLRSDAYRVLEAEDGDAAWDVLRARRCAVAILDLQMPGTTGPESGLEVVRRIKGDARLAGTYVIALTARASPEDVAEGLAAGADLYLTKPFSTRALADAVERALAMLPTVVPGGPVPNRGPRPARGAEAVHPAGGAARP